MNVSLVLGIFRGEEGKGPVLIASTSMHPDHQKKLKFTCIIIISSSMQNTACYRYASTHTSSQLYDACTWDSCLCTVVWGRAGSKQTERRSQLWAPSDQHTKQQVLHVINYALQLNLRHNLCFPISMLRISYMCIHTCSMILRSPSKCMYTCTRHKTWLVIHNEH